MELRQFTFVSMGAAFGVVRPHTYMQRLRLYTVYTVSQRLQTVLVYSTDADATCVYSADM